LDILGFRHEAWERNDAAKPVAHLLILHLQILRANSPCRCLSTKANDLQ
jgi:hypothetical protein